MDEVVGQSRLLAAPGEGLRLAIAHMVNTNSILHQRPHLDQIRSRCDMSISEIHRPCIHIACLHVGAPSFL